MRAPAEEGSEVFSHMTVGGFISSAVSRLYPLYGAHEARAIVRALFEDLKGWSQADMLIRSSDPMTRISHEVMERAMERLLRHEPVQYVTGKARFFGMTLKVNRATLIPRPETEELVQLVTDRETGSDLRVLDIGTGSGCIALALARNLRFPTICAIDISEKALDVARDNASRLKAKVYFTLTDILDASGTEAFARSQGPFDVVVSNPPYVLESERDNMEPNVLDYEPPSALFVKDSDPALFCRAIAQGCRHSLLKPGGRVYFEINPLAAKEVDGALAEAGFVEIEAHRDSQGRQRFITAHLPRP